jgi:hypothetical protein
VQAGPGEVLLMIGGANFYPRTFARLRATPPDARPVTLLFHIEPLPAPRESGLRPAPRHLREWAKIALRDPRRADPRSNAATLRRLVRAGLLDAVAVSTPWRRTYLAEQGIEAEWIPLGHYEQLGEDLGLERDIDVMFVGGQDVPRRARILRSMRRAGLDVVSAGAWGEKGLWGEERTRTLNRTRILLNLGRHPGELSGLRLLLGMANRCCVLSEPIWDPRPFVPDVHHVEAPVDALAGAAAALLADDPRREAIASAGHALATTELTLERTVERLRELALRALRARAAPATPGPAPR